MAQKYLTAFDYVDLHANLILQKHARKRPLGDIETKHRYTPTQPVLSCRTVNIDVTGTRTYRPKSSADIINEQHALIHRIYSKARNIVSAPPRRNTKSPVRTSDENFNKHQKINNTHLNLQSVEVQGRPLTAASQRPDSINNSRKSVSSQSSRRLRTTGHINKSNKRNRPPSGKFLLIRNNAEIIETQRSYRDLTNKIHEQWEPSNHDLNTGIYQRGKKQPDINASVDSWLTFSGSQAEDAEGIVDAFADPIPAKSTKLETIPETDREYNNDQDGQYYNIEGGVGSRIAQQIQKGDKIRIGINGNIQSQDLKVKHWVKEDSFLEDKDNAYDSGKENMGSHNKKVIPLCWDDQVQSSGARVVTPRGPPKEKQTINLCETRPVIFNKLIRDDGTVFIEDQSIYSKQPGFQVKQRKKNKHGLDGKEQENKVTVVTIEARSEDDEKKVANLSVEEIVRKSSEGKGNLKNNAKHSVEFLDSHEVSDVGLSVINEPVLQDNVGSHSKVSFSESVSSGGSDILKHVKIKPTQPTYSKQYSADLDIVGILTGPGGMSESASPLIPGSRSPMPPRSAQTRGGSARSSRSRENPLSARSLQKSPGTRSGVSFSSDISYSSEIRSLSAKVGEPEYIQISQPVKNPNPVTPKRTTDYISQAQRNTSGIREPVPSPEIAVYDELGNDPQSPPRSPPMSAKTTSKSTSKPTTPLAINIPTGEYTESELNSPSRKDIQEKDISPENKRANDMRDEQIDQITELLSGTVIENLVDSNTELEGPS